MLSGAQNSIYSTWLVCWLSYSILQYWYCKADQKANQLGVQYVLNTSRTFRKPTQMQRRHKLGYIKMERFRIVCESHLETQWKNKTNVWDKNSVLPVDELAEVLLRNQSCSSLTPAMCVFSQVINFCLFDSVSYLAVSQPEFTEACLARTNNLLVLLMLFLIGQHSYWAILFQKNIKQGMGVEGIQFPGVLINSM